MATGTSQSYLEAQDKRFRKIGVDKYKKYSAQAEYKKLCKESFDLSPVLKESDVSGFDVMARLDEGVAIAYEVPPQEYDKTLTQYVYGKGFRYTLRASKLDSLFRIFDKLVGKLISSGQWKIEKLVADIFNNGFTTADGGDGTYLFSTTHPTKDSQTSSNRLSTPADLSVTALKQAFIDADSIKDHANQPIILQPDMLLVAKENRFTANEILKSSGMAYSADHTKNVFEDMSIDLAVNHFLTDADAWFLLDKDAMKEYGIELVWQMKPTQESGNDFDTGDYKHKMTMMNAIGYWTWRFGVGTPGA